MDGLYYLGTPIYGINHFEDLDKDVCVIIALHWSEDVIKSMLEREGYQGHVIKLMDIAGGC